MSNGIFFPQGFVPLKYRDGSAYVGATVSMPIDPSSPPIGMNDPVLISSAGKVIGLAANASLAATATATTLVGIFRGCNYQTPSAAQGAIYPYTNSQSWPGSAVNIATGTTPQALVIVDTEVIFNVTTGGSITTGITEAQNYRVAGFTMGTVNAFGQSTSYLSSAPGSGSGATVFAPFQIVGLVDLPNNAWGQPSNNVQVILNGTLTKAGTIGQV